MRKFEMNRGNARECMSAISQACGEFLRAGSDVYITVSDDQSRTTEQNRKMWAMLNDISHQVDWLVDGRMQKMSSEDWKDVLTAGLKRSQRLAAGVDGGMVILGCRTSKMGKREAAELIEFIYWFGSEKSVNWTETRRFIDG